MTAAPVPADESLRLARLRSLAVLDTESEPLFDALTRAAAAVTGRPIALISLIDADRQWLKAGVGLAAGTETRRDTAFCAYTIMGSELMEVDDARRDARFADNPLVTGDPNIRSYAGAPITLSDGLRMGSLCVIDFQPGSLDPMQRETLGALAHAVAEALELRGYAMEEHLAMERETAALHEQMDNGRLLQQKLLASEALLERTGRMAGVGGWELDLDENQLVWSDETCRIHDVPPGHRPSLYEAVNYFAPEARAELEDAMNRAVGSGESWDLQLPLITARERKIWVRTIGKVEYDDAGHAQRVVGAFQDITLRKRAIQALEASDRRFRKLFQYSLGLIFTHDHEGVLLSVNPAAANTLGYSIGELIGRPLTDLIRSELHAQFHEYLIRIITRDNDAGMIELIAKDGSLRIWQYHNVLDDEADEPYVLGHAQDITERYQQERKLRDWSIRDSLTGSFNRRYLSELDAEHVRERLGCIVIDLDHFKHINDTYGHQRGDAVLVDMARFLMRHVRGQDAVVRMGGDEFLILLRKVEPGLTEEIVARLDAGRADAPIGFTLGSVTLEPGESLETGLAEADRRLYKAREGRPRRPL